MVALARLGAPDPATAATTAAAYFEAMDLAQSISAAIASIEPK